MQPIFDLTVSIVNTNNRALLRDCLKSIMNGTVGGKFEIIVVDNASTDGSVEMLRDEFPAVSVVRNLSRQGYGYSHNRAIDRARGEFVLIFNEDMVVLGNALDVMVQKMRQDASIGALGCRLLNADGSLQHSCFKFRSLGQDIFENLLPRNLAFANSKRRGKMYWWQHDDEREVDILMGCCMLIPKKVFEEVGVFDPSFFVYSEEDDLCRRIKSRGYRILFTPAAEVIHFGGQTSKSMSLKMFLVMTDSKIRYAKKHYDPLSAIAYRIAVGLGALLRICGWSLYGAVRPGAGSGYKEMLNRYWRALGLIVGVPRP
jgi:GT2 family glycosyltransferase